MTNSEERSPASGLAATPGAERPPLPNLDGPPGSPNDGAEAVARGLATSLDFVLDVPVRLSVELGRTELPLRDVVNIGRGSIIELDGTPGAPLEVRVNGRLIGRGEIVVINEERLGLRFVEVVSEADPTARLR
jgi:flagellar motor switch protein FliN